MSKILTVFGATGKQGGSVIKTILADHDLSQKFKIRAITRNPSSASSKAISAKGVEVVKADLNDPASVSAAIAGSDTVFAVTNFWELLDNMKATEIAQGHNIADAAKEHNVQHLIWSALENVTEASGGTLPNVEYFDGKAEIDDYIRKLGIPMTSFLPGFYFEQLKTALVKGKDGVYRLSWPVPADTLFPFFYATGDTGKFVAAIIQNRKSLLNGRVPGASGWWSPQEVVDTFEEVTGKKAEYVPLLDGEAWKKTSGRGDKIAQELLENFWFLRDYKYYVTADPEGDVEKAKNLLTLPPTTLKEYLAKETW